MSEFQHVAGLSALAARLRALPDKLAKKHLKAAVGDGAAVFRGEARLLAPVSTGPVSEGHPPPGTLKKSVIMKWIPERSRGLLQTWFVAVRHGKKFQNVQRRKKGVLQAGVNLDAFYWRFVEFGTSKMQAHPFMRPAFENKKRAAVEAIAARLKAGLDQSVIEVGGK